MPTPLTPEAELERLNPRERRYQIGQFFMSAPIGELTAEVAPTGQRPGSSKLGRAYSASRRQVS